LLTAFLWFLRGAFLAAVAERIEAGPKKKGRFIGLLLTFTVREAVMLTTAGAVPLTTGENVPDAGSCLAVGFSTTAARAGMAGEDFAWLISVLLT
jgi:hypothetical protein